MSIILEINGLDNSITISSNVPNNIRDNSYNPIMTDVADLIYNDIISDPNMPPEYVDSMAIAENEEEYEIIIGPVHDKALLQEFGADRAMWLLYRCPKRRYMGGQIRKRIEGKFYLRQFWNENKDKYLGVLRNRVVSNITSGLR